MNWIKLLFPKPHFSISPLLGRFKHVHNIALHIAYYLSQCLALLGLVIVYVVFIIPNKLIQKIKGENPLEPKFSLQDSSYLKSSESVQSIKFKRMY